MKSCHICVDQDFCVIRVTLASIAVPINIALNNGQSITPYQELTAIIAERCNRFEPIN
jgi:hypothetical protein